MLHSHSVLVQEKQKQNSVQQISQNQIPKRVIIANHREPKEKPHCPRTPQAVQVRTSQPLWIFILPQVNQLRHQAESF